MPDTPPPPCALCGAPTGKRPVTAEGRVFCCQGCLHVWNAIDALGVTMDADSIREHPLFQQAMQAGLLPTPGATEPPPPAIGMASNATAEARLRRWDGTLEGMICPSCAWLAEHALARTSGIVDPRIEFLSDALSFRYDPLKTTPEAVGRDLQRFGFRLADNLAGDSETGTVARDLGIAAFLAANVMMLSLVTYVGLFDELDPLVRRVFPWVLAGLTLPVLGYCGRSIFRRGVTSLLAGVPTMQSLLALGSATAFTASIVNALRGNPHYYFDAASVIVVLALFGQSVEARLKQKSGGILAGLRRRLPAKARDEQGKFRPAASFGEGEAVCVRAGELLPLDGTVTAGRGWVDEAMLTGENRPVLKESGSQVLAGTELTDGELSLCVSPGDTTLEQIVDRIRLGLQRPHHWQRLSDRVAAWFFPVVLAIAVAAATVGARQAGLAQGVLRAVAVLVVACPCAFGLATPVVILRAFSVLAQHGIVVADFSVLERLPGIRRVFIDKTGTVTHGAFRLTRVDTWADDAADRAVRLAASAELTAHHPISEALRRAAEERGLRLTMPERVSEQVGCGVEATVEGIRIRVGKRAWFEADGWRLPTAPGRSPKAPDSDGQSTAYWGEDGELRGRFMFADPLRAEAPGLIHELRRRGVPVALISGDSPDAVTRVAERLGIAEATGGLDPQQKVAVIEACPVGCVMIGDGINDAPALAASDIGIAVHSKSLISQDVAAVTLLGSGLDRLPDLLRIADTTCAIQRQNLAWAFGYNFIAIGLAAAGFLHPLLAAVTMTVSSVTILGNSLRLRLPGRAPTTPGGR